MKKIFLLSLSAATLAGCSSGTCDTGDSSCKGGGGTPSIVNYYGDCSEDTTCYWGVDADASIGTVEVIIIETGDPTFSCGPDKALECGVWTETHTNFSLATCNSTGCVERKEIALSVVDDLNDQVNNSSTLFNSDAELGQVTYMFTITDTSGAFADCVVDGHNPSYFSSSGCN